jgi:hypothetical protein
VLEARVVSTIEIQRRDHTAEKAEPRGPPLDPIS